MRKIALILTVGALLIAMSSNVSASLRRFEGTWINSNRHTRGITALDIDVSRHGITVQAWGKCHPRDCDWGKVEAEAYAPDASSNIRESAQLISAVFRSGPGKRLLLIRRGDRNELNVEVLMEFGDRSGRSNYFTTETFVRKMRRPGPPPRPRPMDIREDCVSFNPATTKVRYTHGKWKIADGDHWLFDFGKNKNDAYYALNVIKIYRIDQSCFVGRPHPSFQYLLSSGRAPSGDIRNEDCVPFDPRAIEVRFVHGSWKIADGRHWLFDFGDKESEARQALAIIRKHGFTNSCFVGRPDPRFRYLRR
jgi:hypothetical protein